MAVFIRMGDVELINLDNVTRIILDKRKDKDVLVFYFPDGSSRTFRVDDCLKFAEVFKDLIPYYQAVED